jgi:hypothetical protein
MIKPARRGMQPLPHWTAGTGATLTNGDALMAGSNAGFRKRIARLYRL